MKEISAICLVGIVTIEILELCMGSKTDQAGSPQARDKREWREYYLDG